MNYQFQETFYDFSRYKKLWHFFTIFICKLNILSNISFMVRIIRTKNGPLNIRALKALKQEYAKNKNLCFFYTNLKIKF